MTTPKRPTKRRKPAARAARSRTRKKPARPRDTPPVPAPLEPPVSALVVPEASPEEQEIALSSPEPLFAARVPPPEAERALPDYRRAIFFDVENTSRAMPFPLIIPHPPI